MAGFANKDMCSVGQGGQNTMWMYTTTDADTVVETADYFLALYKGLRVGDMIFANLDTDGTRETKIYYVATATSAGVTITFPTIT